jgi:SAM-dependent methyltransferase
LGTNSPGGFELIAYAVRTAGLKQGDKILDIGCGEGETMNELQERFGLRCTGIDKSAESVKKGKERYKDMDIAEGEADFLEFPIYSFDGVLLECVLSVTEMQTEVIHEAYCVLKNGGKLIVSDLCARASAKVDRPAASAANPDRDAKGSLCDGTNGGAIDPEKLIALCEEIGFTTLLYEDRTTDLDTFVIEKVMEHGSMEQYFASVVPEELLKETFCKASTKGGKLGYFLLIMEKPKKRTEH